MYGEFNSLPSKIFNTKKGTCIIFDSSGIHRVIPIKNGFRYAITKYMYDSKIPLHMSKLIMKSNSILQFKQKMIFFS